MKIILLFLLNGALVVGVFGWLLRSHFDMGKAWLLNNSARERLQTMSVVLTTELRNAEPEEWDAIIEQTGRTHQIQLALFKWSGRQMAGPPMTLPEKVSERLRPPELSGIKPVFRKQKETGQSNPTFTRLSEDQKEQLKQLKREHIERVRLVFNEDEKAPSGSVDSGEESIPSPLDAEASEGRDRIKQAILKGQSKNFTAADYAKEALRTGNPDRYWFLVRLPYLQRSWLVLVGSTDKPGKTGLFFNPRPWLAAAGGVFGISVLLWLPFLRGVTQSISALTRATSEIALGRFSTQVSDKRRDELGQLGGAINQMTYRLHGYVAGQKRFLGDVAHELCSPLARMEVGIAILEQQLAGGDQKRLESVRQELRQMQELVNELLALTKAGMGSDHASRLEPIALAPLVQGALEREAPGVPVIVEIPDGLKVVAAPLLIQRILANLIRNAVQHAEAASPIEIQAMQERDEIILTVADRGPGVSPEALPHLFDPFYREDSSRNRETGGVGLGLAIVKNCVDTCGGKVTAHNREGGGFLVEIRLSGTVDA